MIVQINQQLRALWRQLVVAPYKLLILGCNLLPRTKTLVIVKYDSIGDYVVFRPYLKAIRQSETYKGYKIVLLGNAICKDLAEEFDTPYIDTFYWITLSRIFTSKPHIWQRLLLIALHRPQQILVPVHSRISHFEQWLMVLKNMRKMAPVGDDANMGEAEKKLLDAQYQLLQDPGPAFHETIRFNQSISQLLQQPLEADASFDIRQPITQHEPSIGIFLGGAMLQKQLHERVLTDIVRQLSNRFTGYRILLLGGTDVLQQAAAIMNATQLPSVTNQCGHTSLPELVQIIASLPLLITHDSCAMHMAVATNTPCIAVLQGMNHPRFAPYPHQQQLTCLFPDSMQQWLHAHPNSRMPREHWVNLQQLSDTAAAGIQQQLMAAAHHYLKN